MKILQINATYKIGSTGKIMSDLNDVIAESGYESFMLSGYTINAESHNLYCMSPENYNYVIRKNLLLSRLTGRMGYGKRKATKNSVEWIDSIKPDIIHLHNIHGNWINVKILMEYIKENNIPVVWTLHDCWTFTGRCSHFENFSCEKWKSGCYSCKNNKVYPITYFFDHSKGMWIDKKEWFTNIEKLVLVTPSRWLSDYVKQSFFSGKRVLVINNGIDINTFSPSANVSLHEEELYDKKIVLGVASSWTVNKGLNDFYKLNNLLDGEKYKIVLVGLNAAQLQNVPKGILAIRRTNDVSDLVGLYSRASVFINPTYQDNYPTVNLEAIACGTPVITYKTGGSIESVNEQVGRVVERGNISLLKQAIEELCERKPLSRRECRQYAEDYFDKDVKYQEYLLLYKSL